MVALTKKMIVSAIWLVFSWMVTNEVWVWVCSHPIYRAVDPGPVTVVDLGLHGWVSSLVLY